MTSTDLEKTMTSTDYVVKPRCPKCGKVQADWVKEAQFTCPRCRITFIIQPTPHCRMPFIIQPTFFQQLTKPENSARLKSKEE